MDGSRHNDNNPWSDDDPSLSPNDHHNGGHLPNIDYQDNHQPGGGGGERRVIWGTDINVGECANTFQSFVER